MRTLWSILTSKKASIGKQPCILDATLDADDSARSSFIIELGSQSRPLTGKDILWLYVGHTCPCCGMRERELRGALDSADIATDSFLEKYSQLKAVEVGEDVRNVGRIELMLRSGECLSIGTECSSEEEFSEFKMLTESISGLGTLIRLRQAGCKTRHTNRNSAPKVEFEADALAAEEADRHMKELLEATERDQLALNKPSRKKKQKQKAKLKGECSLKQLQGADDSETMLTNVSSVGLSDSSILLAAADEEHVSEKCTPILQESRTGSEVEHLITEAEDTAQLIEDDGVTAKQENEVAEESAEQSSQDESMPERGTNATWETVARAKGKFKAEQKRRTMDEAVPWWREGQHSNARQDSHEQSTMGENMAKDGVGKEPVVVWNMPSHESKSAIVGREILALVQGPRGYAVVSNNDVVHRDPMPLSVDEFRLMEMEAREDEEGGANQWNHDTFGDDANTSWTFEENLAANEKLLRAQQSENVKNIVKEGTEFTCTELELLARDGQVPSEVSTSKVDMGTQTDLAPCSSGPLHIHLGDYKIDETISALTPMIISPIATRASCFMASAGLPAKLPLSGSGYHSYYEFQVNVTNKVESTDCLSDASTDPCECSQCPSCAPLRSDGEFDGVRILPLPLVV